MSKQRNPKTAKKRLGRPKSTLPKYPKNFSRSRPAPVEVDPKLEEVRESKVMRNVMKFVRASDGPDVESAYEAIVGCQPLGQLLSSNFVEQHHLLDAVRNGLKRLRHKPHMEMGVQFERFDSVPGSRAEVSIKDIRSKSSVYRKAGVSSISCMHFYDMPMSEDPYGFAIMPVMASILFGPGIKRDIDMFRSMQRSKKNAPPAGIDWIDVKSKAERNSAILRVIAPPLVGSEMSRKAAELSGVDGWMKGAGLRAFVGLQLLSMLPLKKRLSAVSLGETIVEPALKMAELRAKGAKHEEPFIHRDGFPHFWFDELRRLELNSLRVPLLKLR